jgi:hypothetical protein
MIWMRSFLVKKDSIFRRGILSFLIFTMLMGNMAPVFAQSEPISQEQGTEEVDFEWVSTGDEPEVTYSELMRDANAVRSGAENSDALRNKFNYHIDSFIQSERLRLQEIGVEQGRIDAYVQLLNYQRDNLDTPLEIENPGELKLPPNPSAFDFERLDTVQIQSLDTQLVSYEQKQDRLSIGNAVQGLLGIESAHARVDLNDLPKVVDMQADDVDIITDGVILEKANELTYNPARIYAFVRDHITYEPYYGSKKGAVGCLQEKVCNDVDAASLTISLLRASGIPARYKKAVAEISVEQLKNVLGVEENKAAFAALAHNNVPIFTVSGGTVGNLSSVDLSKEKAFAVQWVFAETFIEYDQRGGNYNHIDLYSQYTTDVDLQNELKKNYQMQWVPLDTIFRPYNRDKKDILVDTASFNVQTFWDGYFQYSGTLSPLEKYRADLKTATSKDIKDYRSTNTHDGTTDAYIHYGLPYKHGSGSGAAGTILQETWNQLPAVYRNQLKLTLKRESDKTALFTQTFYAPEINNVEFDLSYIGSSATDVATIESYQGIHNTPANLVKIRPVLTGGHIQVTGTTDMNIGELLIMEMEYSMKGTVQSVQDKFSRAGNNEGIYVAFSRVTVPEEIKTNEDIVFAGNAAMAREYLRRVEAATDEISESLDIQHNLHFSGAVVTQSRILNKANGTPTDFEMKGLNINAMSDIVDYSARGNYQNHIKDFRLLYGQQASFEEGQFFKDLTKMQGISTTMGLQHAYANPSSYTVHKITSANKSTIDTLGFSTLTKNNMKKDVDNGNTIITPDKPVTSKNWKGVFYVSIDASGSGLYAIGEQVAGNGGYTTEQLQFVHNNAVSTGGIRIASRSDSYRYSDTSYNYVYIETSAHVRQCSITQSQAQAVINRSDWNSWYGTPCLPKYIVRFGDHSHTVIPATRAIHFSKSGQYNYWIYYDQIDSKFDDYIDAKKRVSSSDLNYLPAPKTYGSRFSPYLGTVVESICEDVGGLFYWGDCPNDEYSTMYYAPSSTDGVYRLQQPFLGVADADKQEAIKRLGWATSDVAYAADSNVNGEVLKGTYQNFVNGQMYQYSKYLFDWEYYTYGKIAEAHNQGGGTRGTLGFPYNNPVLSPNGKVYQLFQNNQEVVWDTNTGSISTRAYSKYACDAYGHVKDPIRLGFYGADGALDVFVDEAKNKADMLGKAWGFLKNPKQAITETTQQTVELYEVVTSLTVDSLLSAIGSGVSDAVTQLKNDYDSAFGPSGCAARISYLGGQIIGQIAREFMPAGGQTLKKLLDFVPNGKSVAKTKGAVHKQLVNKGVTPPVGKFSLDNVGKTLESVGTHGKKVSIGDPTLKKALKVAQDSTGSGNRGKAGEAYLVKLTGGSKNNEKLSIKGNELFDKKGGRIPDVIDKVRGEIHEVKNYSTRVSLDAKIKLQIQKDVELAKHFGYTPIWHFTDAGPTGPLAKYLDEQGIKYFVHQQGD